MPHSKQKQNQVRRLVPATSNIYNKSERSVSHLQTRDEAESLKVWYISELLITFISKFYAFAVIGQSNLISVQPTEKHLTKLTLYCDELHWKSSSSSRFYPVSPKEHKENVISNHFSENRKMTRSQTTKEIFNKKNEVPCYSEKPSYNLITRFRAFFHIHFDFH